MSQPDNERFIASMREARLIERFRIWYALYLTVELDLAELGIAFETRVRVGEMLSDLANIVLVVSRSDGAPPPTPPAA